MRLHESATSNIVHTAHRDGLVFPSRFTQCVRIDNLPYQLVTMNSVVLGPHDGQTNSLQVPILPIIDEDSEGRMYR